MCSVVHYCRQVSVNALLCYCCVPAAAGDVLCDVLLGTVAWCQPDTYRLLTHTEAKAP